MSNDNTPTRETTDAVETENARIGYQVAIDLWTYQGQLNWNRFNVMLVANSVLVSAATVILAAQYLSFFKIVLSGAGLLLCLFWAFMMSRGFDYHAYWSSRARDFEERYLGSVVSTVSECKPVKEGGKLRLSWLSRLGGSQRVGAYFVIVVFAAIYVVVLLQK